MVQQFREKIPIFEAAQWSDDNEVIMEISEWLAENEWPLLDEEDIDLVAEPGDTRIKGHAILENGDLHIQYAEDFKVPDAIPVGKWIVMSRRYHDLTFLTNEEFAYNYEQYGS